MEIHLPVSELKPALPGLLKVLNKSASLPILQHLRVSRSDLGAVQIQTTDLDSFTTYRFNHPQSGEPADLFVPYDSLAKTIKGCTPTDQLVLIQDGHRLTLRYPLAGRHVEQPLASTDPTNWPEVPIVDTEVESLDDSFKAAVNNALACCCEDPTRAALMGAWIDVTDPKAHYVMGTNGRHLYSANSFSLGLKESLLLPHQEFLTWPGFNRDGQWKLAIQPGSKADKSNDTAWLQLQSDHWTFITRTTDHTIPNWRQVVPSADSFNVRVTFTERSSAFLADLLPRLPGKEDSNQPIRFDVSKGKLTVTAREQNADHVTTIPVEDVTVVGPDMAITVNRSFVAKALKFGLTVMEMIDPYSPLLFSAPGRRLVAMPVRTDSAPDPAPVSEPASPDEPDQPSQPQPQQTADTEVSAESAEPNEEPMPKTAATTQAEPTPEPQPINRLVASNDDKADLKPTVRSVIEQIDGLKESLKSVVRQFGDVMDSLRLVEKEKKANDKEVEAVREKLRAIKNVTL